MPMFDDGKLKIYRKGTAKTESGFPEIVLEFYGEVWYGDINFTVKEYYEARQADTKVDRRVRVHMDKALGDKFAAVIDGIRYDIGRVWHGLEKGIAVTDMTLSATLEDYEGAGP